MNVEVDLPRESGFVSDASLLLAEKILVKVGHTGKFSRIGTLDKNGWFAPISLSVTKLDDATFKTTKSSPGTFNYLNHSLKHHFTQMIKACTIKHVVNIYAKVENNVNHE